MAIKILKEEIQTDGEFNGGAILEKRPIMLSTSSGSMQPYSNIFYWAHAWSNEGSLLGQHPHQGFEIMSFVLKGEIEHFDTHYKTWKKLEEGSAQIIRAGSGISHAERFFPNSEIFQIWFDPDLSKTLNKPAEYNDYSSNAFKVREEKGSKVKIFKDENGPVKMDTPGITITETSYSAGEHILELNITRIYSNFILSGKVDAEGYDLKKNDFFVIEDRDRIKITTENEARIFTISSPKVLEYDAYADRYA